MIISKERIRLEFERQHQLSPWLSPAEIVCQIAIYLGVIQEEVASVLQLENA